MEESRVSSTCFESEGSFRAYECSGSKTRDCKSTSRENLKTQEEAKENIVCPKARKNRSHSTSNVDTSSSACAGNLKVRRASVSKNVKNLSSEKLNAVKKGSKPLLSRSHENSLNSIVNKSDASYENMGRPQSESTPILKQTLPASLKIVNSTESGDRAFASDLEDMSLATCLVQSKTSCGNSTAERNSSTCPTSQLNSASAQVNKKKCKRVSIDEFSSQELFSPDPLKTVKIKDSVSKVKKTADQVVTKEVKSKSEASSDRIRGEEHKNEIVAEEGSKADCSDRPKEFRVVECSADKNNIKMRIKNREVSPSHLSLSNYLNDAVDKITDGPNRKKQKKLKKKEKKKSKSNDDLTKMFKVKLKETKTNQASGNELNVEGSSDESFSGKTIHSRKSVVAIDDVDKSECVKVSNPKIDSCDKVSSKSSTQKIGQKSTEKSEKSAAIGAKEKKRRSTVAVNITRKSEDTHGRKPVNAETSEGNTTKDSEKIGIEKSLEKSKQIGSKGRKSLYNKTASKEFEHSGEHLDEIIDAVATNCGKSSEDTVSDSKNNDGINSVRAKSPERKQTKENRTEHINNTEMQRAKLDIVNVSTSLSEGERAVRKKTLAEGNSAKKVKKDFKCRSRINSSSDSSSSDESSSKDPNTSSSSSSSSSDENSPVTKRQKATSAVKSDRPTSTVSGNKKDASNRLETKDVSNIKSTGKPRSRSRSKSLASDRKMSNCDRTSVPVKVLTRPQEKQVHRSSKDDARRKSVSSSRRNGPSGSYERYEQDRKLILKEPPSDKASSIAFRKIPSGDKCDDKEVENSQKSEKGPSSRYSLSRRSKMVMAESFSSPLESKDSHNARSSYSKSKNGTDTKVESNHVASLKNCSEVSRIEDSSRSTKSSFDRIKGQKEGSDKSKQSSLSNDPDDDVIDINASPIASDEEDPFYENCDNFMKELAEKQDRVAVRGKPDQISRRDRSSSVQPDEIISSNKDDPELQLATFGGQSVGGSSQLSDSSDGQKLQFDGIGKALGIRNCLVKMQRIQSLPGLNCPTAELQEEQLEPEATASQPTNRFALLRRLGTEELSFNQQTDIMCQLLHQGTETQALWQESLSRLCKFIYEKGCRKPHVFINEIFLSVTKSESPAFGQVMQPLWILSSNLIIRAYEDKKYEEAYELYCVVKGFDLDIMKRHLLIFDGKYSQTRFMLFLIEILAYQDSDNTIFKIMCMLNLHSLDSKKWEWNAVPSDVQAHRKTCKVIFQRLMERRDDETKERTAVENSLKHIVLFITRNPEEEFNTFKNIGVDLNEIFARAFEIEMFEEIKKVAVKMKDTNFDLVHNILRGFVVAATKLNELDLGASLIRWGVLDYGFYSSNPVQFNPENKELIIKLPMYLVDEELPPYLHYCFKKKLVTIMKLKDRDKILRNPKEASLSIEIQNDRPETDYLFRFLETNSGDERLKYLKEKVIQLLKESYNIAASSSNYIISVNYHSFLVFINGELK